MSDRGICEGFTCRIQSSHPFPGGCQDRTGAGLGIELEETLRAEPRLPEDSVCMSNLNQGCPARTGRHFSNKAVPGSGSGACTARWNRGRRRSPELREQGLVQSGSTRKLPVTK